MDLNIKDHLINEKGLSDGDVLNLFQFWDQLSESEQNLLIQDIKNLDAPQLAQQRQLIQNTSTYSSGVIEPFIDFNYAGCKEDQRIGLELIQQGQMGCLLLAGGQGSRLGSSSAKGIYPISVIKNKSLFQIHAEKVLAAGKQVDRILPLAIMTSPINSEEIQQFFVKNNFFGLRADQVYFFSQGMLPFLNNQGQLFLETPYRIAKGPNGNGLCLKEFVISGIWQKWKDLGINYLNMIQIDNPLADPFDAELLGFHYRQKADVTSKSVEKLRAEERVGVFVKRNGHYCVIEYSEMNEKDKAAIDSQGHLKYRCASLSLFCFSMNFVKVAAEQKKQSLHLAWKSVSFVDRFGMTQKSNRPNAWKFETFIFDVLEYTHKVSALIYPREVCFAPLKNKEGQDSPQTVKIALQNRDRQVYEQITRKKAPSDPFELAQDFYYPTPDLIDYWKNKKMETHQYTNYIKAKG